MFRSRPCFADPPAESPSTTKSSASAGSRTEQSASLPGRAEFSSADLRRVRSRALRAAVRAVRQQQPAKVVVAVPVGAPSTCKALEQEADEVVCLQTPEPFSAVGLWYRRFDQTPDDEVRALLAAAHRRHLRPH